MQDMLRFVTCGSIDDGKSTLIRRLLFESKQVFEDRLAAVAKDLACHGTEGGAIDLALLCDGRRAGCQQSNIIDVVYRFFATPRRRFIVADTPGHEQYTRNMATGTSTSELAVLLVNSRKGFQTQTYRDARIVSMFGIRHLIMAVNKMDLVDWDEVAFSQIVQEFKPVMSALEFDSFTTMPVSALKGDNITRRSSSSPWYAGQSVLSCLEDIDVTHSAKHPSFRMGVQCVNRSSKNRRGYCGRLASGEVKVGDRIQVAPWGMETTIRSIEAWQQEWLAESTGESITRYLEDDIDVTRGDVIASASDPVEMSDQFEAKGLYLSEHRLVARRSYLFNFHTCQAVATITAIKHQVDVKLGTRLAARSLGLNDIGVVNLSIDRVVPFEPYSQCRRLGSFILVDRLSDQSVGAGMIEIALRRAANIHWQAMDIDKNARASRKLQRPLCLWFTGLSGAGKSTIANLLERCLFAKGLHTYTLDGDNIRHGLNRDLGFSEGDRVENIRRITEVSRLLVDAGLVVIVSCISPYRAGREIARSHFALGEFFEIFVDTPLEECERRDPKGLYAKARRGELVNFTGIDSGYEPPNSPEILLDTVHSSAQECVDRIMLVLHDSLLRESNDS